MWLSVDLHVQAQHLVNGNKAELGPTESGDKVRTCIGV
jgi:hypothetical protein